MLMRVFLSVASKKASVLLLSHPTNGVEFVVSQYGVC